MDGYTPQEALKLAQLFDRALSSENADIKSSLMELLTLVQLTEVPREKGFLENTIDNVTHLNKAVESLASRLEWLERQDNMRRENERSEFSVKHQYGEWKTETDPRDWYSRGGGTTVAHPGKLSSGYKFNNSALDKNP